MMNVTISRTAVVVGALSAAILFGCRSSEHARQEARSSASDFQHTLERLPSSIDATTRSLSQMISSANTNRGSTYRELSDNVQAMDTLAQRIGRHANAAETDTREFFRQYARDSMANRDAAAREAAMESIEQREGAVDTALYYLRTGRDRYRTYLASVRDVQSEMRGDLSDESMERFVPRVNAIIAEGAEVKQYVDRLDEQIDEVLGVRR